LATRRGAGFTEPGIRARYLPDGSIEFLGRVDHQVKIHGLRLELGEVEAALARCPAVKAAAVTTITDSHGDTRLVAYVVAGDHRELTINELHDFLRQQVPAHMIPAGFVTLEALPLLPNGKVDRRALPAVEAHCLEPRASFVAPHTPIEIALAKTWTEILGVERAGVDDNFFYSGGHSLTAMQMVSRVRLQFGINLQLRDFFMSPTLGGLAELVEEALIANASSDDIDELLALAEQAEASAQDELPSSK